MKIVDRKTFLSMPENTVFSRYNQDFGDIEIKLNSIYHSFDDEKYSSDFISESVSNALENQGSEDRFDKLYKMERLLDKCDDYQMDFHCGSRYGKFNKEELFAVWSKKDVQDLINRLQECL